MIAILTKTERTDKVVRESGVDVVDDGVTLAFRFHKVYTAPYSDDRYPIVLQPWGNRLVVRVNQSELLEIVSDDEYAIEQQARIDWENGA